MSDPAETGAAPLEDTAPPRARRRWWKPLLFLAALAVIYVLVRWLGLERYLTDARSFIEDLGPWGPLAFTLIYIVATVAMVPAWPLTVAAGALFHPLLGVVYVSIGSTVGAAIAFLIARYVARDAVTAWVLRRPTFRKLNDLTRQHGAWMVAITRLVPIFPYNVINYAFGITGVGFGTYVFWSWLCMLPGTAVYVIGSGAIFRFLEQREVPWFWVSLFAVLTVLLSAVAWFGRRQWKAAVARRRAQHDATPPADSEGEMTR